MKKKILYIHHGSGIGGAPLSLLYLIEKLDKNIYEPKVLFLTDSDVIDLYKNKNIVVKVINLKNYLFLHWEPTWYKVYNPWRFFRDLWNQLFLVYKVAFRIFLEEKPDLIHLNSTFLITWAVVAKKLNITTILHVRESLAKGYFGLRKKIYGYLIDQYCDKVIAISQDNLKRLELKQNNGIVIYNFVDFKKFDKNKSYLEILNKNVDDVFVLYMGGQIKYKGFRVVVNCLKYLDSNIKIIFAGHYKLYQSILKNPVLFYYLKQINNSSNALLVGLSNNIPDLISYSDIILFPSTKPHFARPVIEAFSMGKPVIVSDVEGNDEIVTDGINGLLFKNKSPKDLANKINFLANNGEKRKTFGGNGYNYAHATFNSELNARKTFIVYEELLKNKG